MVKEVKLLNHQYEMLADTETKVLGLISGYGQLKVEVKLTLCVEKQFSQQY